MSDDCVDALTVADVLARGFDLPRLDTPPRPLPAGSICAISGAEIAEGYLLRDLLRQSTAVILDTVRGDLDGYVSETAARCWISTGPGRTLPRGGIAFEDGTAYQPQIALAGRDSGRGCWRDVLRAVWPARRGQRLVAILTTDTKKRLWPAARLGPLGEATPLLLCNGNVYQSLTISWPRLLDCLTLVEAVYALGWPKAVMADSLLGAWKLVESWGFGTTLALDAALAPWRGAPELTVALTIAQRPRGVVDPPPPAPPAQIDHPRDVPPAAPVPEDARPVQGALF